MARIGVLTSGDDAPGMNPCIRAVVRQGVSQEAEMVGVRRGYAGLISGDTLFLEPRTVGGILGQGGTFLQSGRSPEFKTEDGLERALAQVDRMSIDGLVVIGGDGSMAGALALHQAGVPTVGIPATIENDLGGTRIAIGVDTALNTVLNAIDRIRDTASSHGRAFVVEVAGRDTGYLAIMAGLTGGAEAIVIPEVETTLDEIARDLENAYIRGKSHAIVVVAEGAEPGTHTIRDHLEQQEIGFEARATILGHVQRGGRPSAFDRELAAELGAGAVDSLLASESGVMIGRPADEAVAVPLDEVIERHRSPDLRYYHLARTLAE